MKKLIFCTAIVLMLAMSYESTICFAYGNTADDTAIYKKNINHICTYKASVNGEDKTIDDIYFAEEAIDVPVQTDPVESFVSRLYQNFLGRQADANGLASWTTALKTKKATGAKVVYGFVYSQEFQNNPLSNEAFVTAMYNTILGRDPDDSGLRSWVTVLENGCTRKKVLSGFLNSHEMRELCRSIGIEPGEYHSDEIIDNNTKVSYFVSRMYKFCLDRSADYSGLNSWVTALTEGRASGRKIAEGFFYSTEMKNKNLSNKEYVTTAYKALLDRDPDQSGLNAWTDALAKNNDRTRIIDGFIRSEEFRSLCESYGIMAENLEKSYYDYIKNVLIPKYGLAPVGTKEDVMYKMEDEWLYCSGIVSAYVEDLDNDGKNELFLIYLKEEQVDVYYPGSGYEYVMHAAVYRMDNGVAQLLDDRLFPYEFDFSDLTVAIMRNEFVTKNFRISTVERGGEVLILVEYNYIPEYFADGEAVFTQYSMRFNGKKLVLDMVFADVEIGGGDSEYWGLEYNDGRIIHKEKLYSDWPAISEEADGDGGKYSGLKEALEYFWNKRGLHTTVSDNRYTYQGKVFTDSDINSIMSCTSKLVSVNEPSGIKMRFTLTDYTDLRNK